MQRDIRKKSLLRLLIFIIVLGGIIFFFFRNGQNDSSRQVSQAENKGPSPTNSASVAAVGNTADSQVGTQQQTQQAQASAFSPPIDGAKDRVTKKPFGIYITPKTSPVQPERFMGYHTGTDFETFPDEANVDVQIRAVCSGNLLLKERASGYGGVAVQNCTLNGQPITVVYGHLRLSSISINTGQHLDQGQVIGVLGTGFSSETDGERKHLHLGFHKGAAVNIRGYVSSASGLSEWIDACQYVCSNSNN